MTEQLVIEDPNLARQLQQIAEQEQRSIEEVLASMVTQYRPQPTVDQPPEMVEMAQYVRQVAYAEARDYWNRTGNTERAAMTDKELDEAFWLFDADGIPRLKADQDTVELPQSSLYRAGQVLGSAGFHSGQSDISALSREILNDEFTDYLLSRMKSSANDANNNSST